MNRFYHMVLTLCVAAALSTGCSRGHKKAVIAFPDSVVDGEVVAMVNSEPIHGRDLRVFAMVYQPGVRDSLHTRLFNLELLNGYIDRVLFWKEASTNGVSVPDSVTNVYIARFVSALGGEAALQKRILSQGITRDEIRSTIRRDLDVRAYIEGRLASSIHVSEDSARAWFDRNKQRLAGKDSVRARHIILLAHPGDSDSVVAVRRAQLEALRKRVVAGEDFAALARANSEGPSASKGGDLGYFAHNDMVAPFADAAFALKPGQISDVVKTRFGLHLIKVLGRKKARPVRYEDVRKRVIARLRELALSQEVKIHLQRNRATAIIQPEFDYGGLTQRESATFTR